MKIAHVLAEIAPLGGAETYAFGLADAQRARGDDVHVLAAGSDTRGFDIVHAHGTVRTDGAHVVRSLHDYAFACASGERSFRNGSSCTRAHGAGCFAGLLVQGCAHRLDLRPALRSHRAISRSLPVLRSGSAVLAHSDAVAAAARANGFERVHVVPYFVERVADPTTPPSRRLAFVGRIVEAKGLDVALRALAQAPDVWDRFDVVGDGWARPAAESLARRLGLTNRVTFHGWLDPAAVANVLEHTSALLLPSRWPEPFGIVGLEAFAHARPVIASRVGGIPEWLDADAGALVPPGDAAALATAVTALLPRAAELGRAAWDRVARYSVESHLAALDAVYEVAA